MSGFINDDLPGHSTLDGIWSGSIAVGAATVNDPVQVLIRAFDDEGDSYRFGPCRWITRGTSLPQRGQDCIVAFDEDRRPYVLAWWDGTGGEGTIGPGEIGTTELADNSVTSAKILNGTIVDADVAAANKDGAASTPSLRTLGSGAAQAAPGNDTRLSDSRIPTGTAGGELAGTFPNPSIKDGVVTTAKQASGFKANDADKLDGLDSTVFARIDNIEAWREIGAGGQPAFLNSWVNFGAGFDTAAFFKDPFGIVHLKGLVKNGSVEAAVFQLPSGYKPASIRRFATESGGGHAFVDIDSAGNVTLRGGTNTSYSINGISFKP